MRKNSVVYLLWMLLCFSGCKTTREIDTVNARKEDCSRFVYCPVTLVLLQGDTIRGRFTTASGIFYQVHENNDSNINRTGKENTLKDRYYPVSTWFKRFTPEEINTFTVNGRTLETVILVADKNGNDMPWNSYYIFYLPRLTPDSSQIQLYISFTPHSHGDSKASGWGDFFGGIVMDMVAPGYYTYYIHFPGETPHKVWVADQSSIGLAAKTKMAELFSTCPELRSLAEQIKESSGKADLIHAMLSREELKYPKTIPAILAIFKKYDDCCYRNKN
jgi:hypothetical protein